MTVKKVADRCGVTGETLRYYERVGMLPPVTRTAGGIDQKRAIDETPARLDVKIGRYEDAVRTGKPCWDKDGCGA